MAVLLIGAGAAAGAGVTALLLRRRPATEAAGGIDAVAFEDPAPAPVEAAMPPIAGARLDLSLLAARAGLNLLSATVEADLTVTNGGTAAAEDVRVGALLLSAHAAQDADLAAALSQPVGRPAVSPFRLAAGEHRTMRVVVALPRDAIRTIAAAGGRPMFVPVVAVNCLYRADGGIAQAAQAFAVGIERPDSTKLAPFWLDGPPRMHDQVAARPHAAPLRR